MYICICIYVCMCIYISICIHIYMFIIYVYIYMHTYIHIWVHMCIRIWKITYLICLCFLIYFTVLLSLGPEEKRKENYIIIHVYRQCAVSLDLAVPCGFSTQYFRKMIMLYYVFRWCANDLWVLHKCK